MPEAAWGPCPSSASPPRPSCLQNLLCFSQRGFRGVREVQAGRPGGSIGRDTMFPQHMTHQENERVRPGSGASAAPETAGPVSYTCGPILKITLIKIK